MLQNLLNNKRLPALMVAVGAGVLLIAVGVIMAARQEQSIQIAFAQTQTMIAITSAASATPSQSPSETPVPSDTPTGTVPPTFTAGPTSTASPTPVPPRVASIDTGGYATPANPLSTAIPTPADPVGVPNGVINIMLLGSDRREDDSGYRTDSIIIVSINQNEGTVNMLSLPRDLYVYIPGWTMQRLNTADGRGAAVGWKGGGPGLLRETLLYNFGITIHYYARVEFDNFKQIVNILGGIDVPVDCALQGFRLKEPRRSRADFSDYAQWVDYTGDDNNWEIYTMPVGVQHLDGYMALWYARLRHGVEPSHNYTDYDRARRQQQVLRAILSKARSVGLITRVPELWTQYGDLVETDMGLGNMLQLAPIAVNLKSNEISSYFVDSNILIPWTNPADGSSVLLPVPGAVEHLAAIAMQPPAQNYLASNTVRVEVRNGTSFERIDEVAADRLQAEGGMLVVPTGAADKTTYEKTIIYDFTGRSKTGELFKLQHLLHVADSEVIVQPDPNRAFDYVIILGSDYTNRSCTYNVPAPVDLTPMAPTPTP